MSKYILSAFSDEYDDDLETQCKALKTFGIQYTEIRHFNGKNVLDLTFAEATEAKKVLNTYGIKVSSIGSPIGKIKINADLTKHLDELEHVLKLADIFETENIRVFSFYSNGVDCITNSKEEILDWFEKAIRLSQKYGVTLCHENEALIYGESPDKCLELVSAFHGKMKCVFDMGNFVLDGYDSLDAYELLKEHIEYFHVKDALSVGAIVPAGKGEAKIKEILFKHKNAKKTDVFVTLEPHLQTFAGLNALVGKTFDNPYKYENQREAFTDAVQNLKEILDVVNGDL